MQLESQNAQKETQKELHRMALVVNDLQNKMAPLASVGVDTPYLTGRLTDLSTKVDDLEKSLTAKSSEIFQLQLESATNKGAKNVIYAILGVLSTFIIGGTIWLIQLSGKP